MFQFYRHDVYLIFQVLTFVLQESHSLHFERSPFAAYLKRQKKMLALQAKLSSPYCPSHILTLRLQMSYIYIYVYIYTGCPRRKGQNFGRVFLMLKYTDITQNTYNQSWTVTEIMAREKCGLLAGLRTVPCQLTAFRMSVLHCRVRLQKYR